MDDDALYGPGGYRLPRGEAEERGVVVPLRLVFVNATEAYEELTRREPRLRVLLDATARSVSREHAEQVLAVWDCYRQRSVTTAFTFHSSTARAERFQPATESVLAALEVLAMHDDLGQGRGHAHRTAIRFGTRDRAACARGRGPSRRRSAAGRARARAGTRARVYAGRHLQ